MTMTNCKFIGKKCWTFLIALCVAYNKFIPCCHQWRSMEIATVAKRIANKTAKAVCPATHSPFTMPIFVQCG